MKILVASHSYIVDLNCEKLRELAKLSPDLDVTIVVPKRWRPGGVQTKTIEPKFQESGNFRIVPIANFSENNQGLLSFGWELVSLLRKLRPDIIQVEQGSKSLAYAQMIFLNQVLGLKAKLLFFTWWNLPYELKFPVSLLEAYNLGHTDGIVVGNQDGEQVLRDRGYGGPMRIMAQLGVDEALFRPRPIDEGGLRSANHLTRDDFVVGFVGRFVPEKGILTLAKALGELRDRPWKLLLLGRGPLEAELRDWMEQQGLSDRLRLIPSVPHDQVAAYIAQMNALILPSETTYQFKTLTSAGWKEQFGHVLIEAMACRVPVIGSDSGEIPNVIRDGGLVFPEGDIPALADRLAQLMDDRAFASRIAEAGYQRALTHYTNRAMAQSLLTFYQSLCGEPIAQASLNPTHLNPVNLSPATET
jgi:L-malate glycosyltransferase